MKQAASLKGLRLGMLLPGIAIDTSAADFAPLEQMLMMRFTGGQWKRFGSVLNGIDPGAVSEGFKAIFKYGTATRETAGQQNANTVTMMTGTFDGTYVQIGADLASVLDDGRNFRLLPVVGQGSVQAVADILFLKGVDVGIVRTDTLDYLEKKAMPTTSRGSLPTSPSSTTRKCTSLPQRRSVIFKTWTAKRSRSTCRTAELSSPR